jgi:hypothetical protein
MNRYAPMPFRPVFGIAAAALSAVTLAVMVVLPVGLATGCPTDSLLARAPAAIEADIDAARIEVVGMPARTVTLAPISVVAQREPRAS